MVYYIILYCFVCCCFFTSLFKDAAEQIYCTEWAGSLSCPFAWVPILTHACQNYKTQPQILWLCLICSSVFDLLDYMLTVLASELVRFCRSSDNRCNIFPLNVPTVLFLQQVVSAVRAGVNPSENSFNQTSLWDISSSFFFAGTVITTIGKWCLPPPPPHLFVCLKVFPWSSFLHFCLHTIQFCFVLAEN